MDLHDINQKLFPPPVQSERLVSSKPDQNLPHRISSLKMKPKLGKRVTFRCSIPSNIAYIAKYRPKMLSTMEVVSLQSTQPNFKAVKTICKVLKDIKRAASLIIRKDDSNSQNLKQLKHLFNNTHHHWRALTLSYINSSGEENSIDPEVVQILTRLRKYRDFSTLDVYLCCPKDLKNPILFHLSQQLKGIKNLKTLHLDLSDNSNREELPIDYEPNTPILTFRYPKSLRFLHLSLQKSNFPHQKMLSTFVSNLYRCNSLIKLHLDCGLHISKPLDLNILAPLFERVQRLKSFDLTMHFPSHLQLQDCIDSVKSFGSLKHLLELELLIFFSGLGSAPNVFAKNFFKNLASLTNLKSLTLQFVVKKFSLDSDDLDNQNLFLPLQDLGNLQTLHFCLECDKDRELPGLQSLSQAIQSLHSLKDLGFALLCKTVSHSDLLSISQMFKNLTSLENLLLGFYDTDLESDSLESLFAGISHLKLSKFFFNSRLENSGLQQKEANIWKHQKKLTPFFKALSSFTTLRYLHLNLSVFDFLTKDLLSLADALKNMKKLRYLFLELPQLPPARRFHGLGNLLSSIKDMSELFYLGLIFKGDKLCDEEVELVALNLAECSSLVEVLELNFSLTKELKNRSLLALQNGLRNLHDLENLKLIFGPKNTFHGEPVFQLFEVLSHLKNLEIVTILLPAEVVPLDFSGILRKFAGHWSLNTLIVNEKSWLKSVNQNQG